MSKKPNNTPIILTPDVLSRMADQLMKESAAGRPATKNGYLNTMTKVIAGDGKNFGFLKGSGKPVYANNVDPQLLLSQIAPSTPSAEQHAEVFVTTWEFAGGTEVEVFPTEEDVEAYRQSIAANNWDEQMPNIDRPANFSDAADLYFETMQIAPSRETFRVSPATSGPFLQEKYKYSTTPDYRIVMDALREVRSEWPDETITNSPIETVRDLTPYVSKIMSSLVREPEAIVPDEIGMVWMFLNIYADKVIDIYTVDDFDKWTSVQRAFTRMSERLNYTEVQVAQREKQRGDVHRMAAVAFTDLINDSHHFSDFRGSIDYENLLASPKLMHKFATQCADEYVAENSSPNDANDLERVVDDITHPYTDSPVDIARHAIQRICGVFPTQRPGRTI